MFILDEMRISYKMQDDIYFSYFYLQFMSWFAIQTEFDWPAGNFKYNFLVEILIETHFIIDLMIELYVKDNIGISLRHFLVQFLPWLVSNEFIIINLSYDQNATGNYI